MWVPSLPRPAYTPTFSCARKLLSPPIGSLNERGQLRCRTSSHVVVFVWFSHPRLSVLRSTAIVSPTRSRLPTSPPRGRRVSTFSRKAPRSDFLPSLWLCTGALLSSRRLGRGWPPLVMSESSALDDDDFKQSRRWPSRDSHFQLANHILFSDNLEQRTITVIPEIRYSNGVYIAGPAFPSSPTSGTAVSANSFPSLPLSSSSTSSLPGLPEAPRPRTVPLPDVINDFRERYVGSHSSQVPPQPCVVDHGRLRLLNRPTVDPLLATPQHPTARPSLKWDLRHHPTTALLENSSISHADLSHCAIRSTGTGRAPVQSLILIFPLLPMEIEIRTSLSRTSRRAPGSVPCITVGDVLEGLYQGLRAPIEPRDFVRLSESEQRTLLRACEARCRCLPEDERSRHALRKVDYLARRRCFLGIWPAMPYEVPYGRRSREVYVVEVGTGDN